LGIRMGTGALGSIAGGTINRQIAGVTQTLSAVQGDAIGGSAGVWVANWARRSA
jgi:hypothetical protein